MFDNIFEDMGIIGGWGGGIKRTATLQPKQVLSVLVHNDKDLCSARMGGWVRDARSSNSRFICTRCDLTSMIESSANKLKVDAYPEHIGRRDLAMTC